MRFANIVGRAHLHLGEDRYVDIAEASGGAFPVEPSGCLDRWSEVSSWAAAFEETDADVRRYDAGMLGSPVPDPRQIFAVGLNYAKHVEEMGLAGSLSVPLTFAKFPSSITGPVGELVLPADTVDWEVELVAVVGRPAHKVSAEDAWGVLAGLALGQDYSERVGQMAGTPPQFSIAKSYPGFAPLGPVIVSIDEFRDRDNIALACTINGRQVQSASTRQMIHSIPRIIEHISSICPLRPGDLIFTGTPDGVGMGRTPTQYLKHGDVIVSSSPEIGELRQVARQNAA